MEHAEISTTAARAVRLPFNPDGPAQGRVTQIKEAAAQLITLLEEVRDSHSGRGDSCAREAAIAITHVQTASMFGVFAATAP